MKRIRCILWLLPFFYSCNQSDKNIVSSTFIDSLTRHYTPPAIFKANEAEMQFWKSRISLMQPGYLNESRYAGCLAMRFRILGDIGDLRMSDSVLEKINSDFNNKEASSNLALAAHAITQHRFMQADGFLQRAIELGLRPYESLTTSFDVNFELGKYSDAMIELNAIHNSGDYGYYFRKSKIDHLKASLDSAISAMQKAADLAGKNSYLKGVALANEADLYIHAGDLQQANDIYTQCLRMNSADFHSMIGLGWIAMVHDKNNILAEKIFRFVASKNRLPDPLFKLSQMAEAMGDSASLEIYAHDFVQKATAPEYGRMYNKYLIELYTSVLKSPSKAELIAKDELNNRATPQTYAWYAWALFMNHKKEEAYRVYEQYVSGKPLEGLELYWMGKIMAGLNKGYNAQAFFKAAYKNKYDLTIDMRRDIERQLN